MKNKFCDMTCANDHGNVVISLPGEMPDCSGDMLRCDAPVFPGECLSVDCGEVLYTLQSGWEKRKISLSVSHFKRPCPIVRRSILPVVMPVIPKLGQCFFGQFSRLRL